MANEQTPTATVTTSKQFLLNLRDLLHSLFMGVLGAIASPLLTYLETNNLQFNLKDMWHLAAMAAITYLLKNWLKPSQTIVTITPPEKVKVLDENGGSGTEIPSKPPPNP